MKPVWLVATTACDSVAFSACSTLPADMSTSSQSTLGPPAAPVAVARMELVPASRAAMTDLVCQVSQLPVTANATPLATTVPLTAMSMVRLAVEPLAKRMASMAWPAVAVLTLHWTKLPTTLS